MLSVKSNNLLSIYTKNNIHNINRFAVLVVVICFFFDCTKWGRDSSFLYHTGDLRKNTPCRETSKSFGRSFRRTCWRI